MDVYKRPPGKAFGTSATRYAMPHPICCLPVVYLVRGLMYCDADHSFSILILLYYTQADAQDFERLLMEEPLLTVRDLSVEFKDDTGETELLRNYTSSTSRRASCSACRASSTRSGAHGRAWGDAVRARRGRQVRRLSTGWRHGLRPQAQRMQPGEAPCAQGCLGAAGRDANSGGADCGDCSSQGAGRGDAAGPRRHSLFSYVPYLCI